MSEPSLPHAHLSKKTFQGNFFEDFELGDRLIHPTPRTITAGDVSLYTALTGSRFAIYCAETVAQQCGFEQAPIDNFLVFHIAFGKTVPDISLNAVANLGYAECQFLTPCFVGDTLSVESTVIGLKENSNGKTGIVYVHSVAKNQHDKVVVSWKRWVMVHKKVPSSPTGVDSLPDLARTVAITGEHIPSGLDFSHFNPQWTSSPYLLNDYQSGEWINHVDGMTINPSDHSLATRLYQNNAKVHFDAFAMQQERHKQPLVYGGHVMSICRALAHNGLANGLWLAAINGGSHTAPSFAGDTLYSVSQIIDLGNIEQRNDIGWLRVKTYGLKNVTAEQISQFIEEPKSLIDSQVLELDYTLLVPAKSDH
ncbi:MaoC family dehydratase [Pleionea litopenaei]|uniref:MaoC family dehydratase n=1 Tax=Pleionea litopenaei TaxID=3070815 RepID=A0AA51RWS3_9GAMM|nr:MaoC family dehydratase [Pleionea sp. HL-JVS1]WMS88889.1 MaoC family dehydratase [Pleionea sp. HL-JVS1]